MNKSDKIGIFDSGIGGVTVLKKILEVLPKEDYIYYSDSINNPYGDKPKDEIIEICEKVIKYLFDRKCKIIVVACNTATAIALDTIRKKYPQKVFIGIEPAYKMVHDNNPEETVLVMATKGTIESEKFNILYNKYNNKKTYLLPCIGLADIIEEGNKTKLKKYLSENLSEYKQKVENVVLGCTHYPLAIEEIKEVLGDVNFYEGSYNLALHLKDVLEKEKLLNDKGNSKIEFFDSSNSEKKKQRFYDILKK